MRKGGKLFVEEPDGRLMASLQRLLPEAHPKEAFFQLRDLEENLEEKGFTVLERRWAFGFGFYCAQKPMMAKANHIAA